MVVNQISRDGTRGLSAPWAASLPQPSSEFQPAHYKKGANALESSQSSIADQAALEEKYAPVGQAITDYSDYGSKMDGIFMQGDKLVLKCEVPFKVVSNRVWDAIKKCDPNYPDSEIQMTLAGGDAQPYTIKSGDTLSAVCLKFYGNANKYPQVAEANGIDANHVSVGTTIELPLLS